MTPYDRNRNCCISGSTLKLIGLSCMLLDHIGAVFLTGSGETERILFFIFRLLFGRAAFPIFCFLLIEGAYHTSNRPRYLLRLTGFAILSEIPFDLAMYGLPLEFSHQNVFFTLAIGLLTILASQTVSQKLRKKRCPLQALLSLLPIAIGMVSAQFLKTDYGALGILVIAILFFSRRNRDAQLWAGSTVLVIGGILMLRTMDELLAPIGLILCRFYNGTRGLKLKYSFYAFYPLHLLLLWILRIIIA